MRLIIKIIILKNHKTNTSSFHDQAQIIFQTHSFDAGKGGRKENRPDTAAMGAPLEA